MSKALSIAQTRNIQATTNPLRRAVSVAMTAAASGSNGIQVVGDPDINMGTNDFTLHWEGALPDWTPASETRLLQHLSTGSSPFTGHYFSVWANGTLFVPLFRNDVGVNHFSTVATGIADGAFAKVTTVVVRETASAAGSITYYVDGVQLGAAVPITAAATATLTSANSLFISGRSTVRTACDLNQAIIYNRALSAPEVLSLHTNGPALADVGASQTVLNTSTCVNGAGGNAYGTFSGASSSGFSAADATGGAIDKLAGTADEITIVAGRTYRIAMTLVVTSGQRPTISVRESMTAGSYAATAATQATIPASGVFDFVATLSGTFVAYFGNSLASDFVVSSLTIKAVGITGMWNAEDAQSNTGQIFDSSGNKNHALLPASGATIIPEKREGVVRWTNTWAETSELQYIGGVNQAILPARARIDSIVGAITSTGGSGVQDIIIGDGSDTDRYVALTTALATGTATFTLTSTPHTDGTNLKLTVDPDATCTMSIAWTIKYTVLE